MRFGDRRRSLFRRLLRLRSTRTGRSCFRRSDFRRSVFRRSPPPALSGERICPPSMLIEPAVGLSASLAFAAVTISGRCFLTNSQRSSSDISAAASCPANAPMASRETQIARIFPSIQISTSVLLPLARIASFSIEALLQRLAGPPMDADTVTVRLPATLDNSD